MLKRIKKLLTGHLPTIEQIDQTAASIDVPSLEAALAAAQEKRAAMLVDGSVDEVLEAERASDIVRIELERAHIALAELERRRAEAESKAARDALESQRSDVQAKVDSAVKRIEAEYPKHAAAIAELAALAKVADASAHAWRKAIIEGEAGGLPPVDSVATRLGWDAEFFSNPDFSDATILPPVCDFGGYNDEKSFVTHLHHFAVYGGGNGGDKLRTQQAKGPRWGRV